MDVVVDGKHGTQSQKGLVACLWMPEHLSSAM